MINTGKKQLSDFGNEFQIKLAKIIALDRSFSNRIRDVINLDSFEIDYLKIFLSKIFEYKDKYKSHPSISTIESIVNTEIKFDNKIYENAVKSLVNNIKFEQEIIDQEYIKDAAITFFKVQKTKEAIGKYADLLETGELDVFKSKIDDCFRLGVDLESGLDYRQDVEKRYEDDQRDGVCTSGWPDVDALTDGGPIAKGEVAIYMAPTGKGKSMRLVHTGSANLFAGKSVLYYSLELKDSVIARRFDACNFGIKLQNLKSKTGLMKKYIDEIPGKLYVKHFPMYSASAQTLENHYQKMIENGIKIDLVIIDYLDLLISSSKKQDDLGFQVYSEVCSMVSRNRIACLSAAQTNRASIDADIVTFNHIQDGYKRMGPIDYAMGFSSTGNAFICKNRNGPDNRLLREETDFSIVSSKLTDDNAISGFSNYEQEESEEEAETNLQNFILKKRSMLNT
jgi:hypothetical protein